jgi:peptide subunit release factor RF-3
MKALHVRTGKEMKLANALTFMASGPRNRRRGLCRAT